MLSLFVQTTGGYNDAPIGRPPFEQKVDRKKIWSDSQHLVPEKTQAHEVGNIEEADFVSSFTRFALEQTGAPHHASFNVQSPHILAFDYQKPRCSPKRIELQAELVLRNHYTRIILDNLKKVQSYIGDASMSVFVCNALMSIDRLSDASPHDPFINILMALYDALAFDNKWTEYTQVQYQAAVDIVFKYCNDAKMTSQKAAKGILELERVGFSTIPFHIEVDENHADNQCCDEE